MARRVGAGCGGRRVGAGWSVSVGQGAKALAAGEKTLRRAEDILLARGAPSGQTYFIRLIKHLRDTLRYCQIKKFLVEALEESLGRREKGRNRRGTGKPDG